jgi:hypothetical protein
VGFFLKTHADSSFLTTEDIDIETISKIDGAFHRSTF